MIRNSIQVLLSNISWKWGKLCDGILETTVTGIHDKLRR